MVRTFILAAAMITGFGMTQADAHMRRHNHHFYGEWHAVENDHDYHHGHYWYREQLCYSAAREGNAGPGVDRNDYNVSSRGNVTIWRAVPMLAHRC